MFLDNHEKGIKATFTTAGAEENRGTAAEESHETGTEDGREAGTEENGGSVEVINVDPSDASSSIELHRPSKRRRLLQSTNVDDMTITVSGTLDTISAQPSMLARNKIFHLVQSLRDAVNQEDFFTRGFNEGLNELRQETDASKQESHLLRMELAECKRELQVAEESLRQVRGQLSGLDGEVRRLNGALLEAQNDLGTKTKLLDLMKHLAQGLSLLLENDDILEEPQQWS